MKIKNNSKTQRKLSTKMFYLVKRRNLFLQVHILMAVVEATLVEVHQVAAILVVLILVHLGM